MPAALTQARLASGSMAVSSAGPAAGRPAARTCAPPPPPVPARGRAPTPRRGSLASVSATTPQPRFLLSGGRRPGRSASPPPTPPTLAAALAKAAAAAAAVAVEAPATTHRGARLSSAPMSPPADAMPAGLPMGGGPGHGEDGGNGASSHTPGSGASSSSFPFSLAQLALFRSVAAEGSLESAAAASARTPAAIAAGIAKLERELGVALLTEAGGAEGEEGLDAAGAVADHAPLVPPPSSSSPSRRLPPSAPVHLTPAGALLDRYAERILSLAADAAAAARDAGALRTGSVFLAASQTTGVYTLPRLIAAFKARHPGVDVSLQVENTRRCCAAVARGEADAAVVGGAIPPELEHLLSVRPFAQDEVVVVVPPAHPAAAAAAAAGTGSIPVDALPSLSYVSLHKSSTVQGVRARLAEAGLDWRVLGVVLEVNSVEAIKAAVEAGLGAAFVSAAAVSKEVALGTLVALRVEGAELSRMLWLVTDPGRHLPRAAREFCAHECGGGNGQGGRLAAAGGGAAVAATCDVAAAAAASAAAAAAAGAGSHYPHLAGRAPSLGELGSGRDTRVGRGGSGGRGSGGGGPHAAREGMMTADPASAPGSPSSSSHAAPPSAPPSPSAPSSSTGPARPLMEPQPFTLAQLAAFQAFARTGSGTAAGAALGVSQPAVHKALAVLEAALGGGPLVTPRRRGGGAFLTDAGAALLPHADRALAAAREASQALADLASAGAGALRLGASQTVGTYLLPRLLAGFRAHHPRIAVRLDVDGSRPICGAVAAGDLDVALVGGGVPSDLVASGAVSARPFATDEVVLIVPAGHALAGAGDGGGGGAVGGGGGGVEAEALYATPFVCLHPGSSTRAAQDALLREAGILPARLRVEMEFSSVEAIKGAVAAGLGAAFVSAAAVDKEVALGLVCVVPLTGGRRLTRTLWLVEPGRAAPRPPSPAAAKFVSSLVAAAEGNGWGGGGGGGSGAGGHLAPPSSLPSAARRGRLPRLGSRCPPRPWEAVGA